MHRFTRFTRALIFIPIALLSLFLPPTIKASAAGYPADQNWEAVTYGDGKFVAVASSGNGDRVMTSTNGNYWTSRTSASDSNWQGITYAGNQFVAVGSNAVMTSPDGIAWTSRTAPVGEWQAITNCGGLYVATATWGSNYIMSSTDGIEWTVRTPSTAWSHDAVACSAEVPRFVSVSMYGRGWSSANGTTLWLTQNPGAIVDIRTVAFGAGRFSWLEYSTNTGNRYGAYSTNGVNWTNTASAPANQWKYITYGGNKFIAVAEGGVNSRSAYSTDGANWTLGSEVPNNSWQSVAYGAGKYVAVANSGTGNRVMTSTDGQSWESLSVTPPPYLNSVTNLTVVANADGSVNLDWNAPTSSNVDIYAYAVTFYDLDEIGGTTSGGWGVWTNQGTDYSLGEWMFSGSNPVTTGFGPVRFGIKAGSQSCFSNEGVGPCVYGPETTVDAVVLNPAFNTTTTTSTTTTTVSPTTTTLPLIQSNNGCGPYRAFTVTGTTGGTIWGSGPYTDDSAFAAAAVHAGLIEVGETAIIEPYAVDNYLWYDASYANGVYTNDWHSSWCGYQIKLLGTATPGTTTTTSTITTSSTSTTSTSIVPTTTTSTIVILPPNNTTSTTSTTSTTTTTEPETTTTEPETTTTVSPSTTTLIETIFDPVEVTLVETPTSTDNTESEEPATSVPQYAPEQEATTDEAPIEVPKDTQDAANAAVADIFDGPISDAKLGDAVDDLVADAGTPEELTAVVTALLDQELTDTQFSTVINSLFDGPLSDENFSAAVDAVFADTSALSDEQFDTAVQAVFDETLTTEQFADALEAIFKKPLSDEKFDAIINAVLDEPLSDEQFEELVGVLESDTVTEEQVAAAVDSVIKNGITEDQATELATSAKVLQSIEGEQASEIFDAVDISHVTPEEAAQLVNAVQNASSEVRSSFEQEINVFDGAVDTYQPLGSEVNVGQRRVLVAIGAVLSSLPTLAGSGPISSSGGSTGGGGTGGGGGSSDGSSNRRRRGA